MTREVRRWNDQSEETLRDALGDVDWDMFRCSSGNNVCEYAGVVTSFVATVTDQVIPMVKVKVFPNQKPWVDRSVRVALRERSTAYNSGLLSGDMTEYKASRYRLRRVIANAKRGYRDKIEAQFQSDTRGMWQGLRNITDYKGNRPSVSADAALVNDLNSFYARFEAGGANANANANANAIAGPADVLGGGSVIADTAGTPVFTEHDVRRELKKVNTRKAAGPDRIPGRVIRACADLLAPVFTTIFNLSLVQSVVPTCFKESIIVPVPKNSSPACLNDYRPVALTSVVAKCFEKLVKNHICSSLPDTLDPLQFAYRPNRSTDDAISQVMHATLSHLDTRGGGYVRLLFIDFSSAFNTVVPTRLAAKLRDLGLNSSVCSWILDFLTARPQVVRAGGHTSHPLILNTGAPQGCVLSPLLYSLYTHDCTARHSANTVVKFADDTVVVGPITDNDERAYLQEVSDLTAWCQDNNLLLNVGKTKEMVVDFCPLRQRTYAPLLVNGAPVERVSCFKYLGVHISEDLTWTTHTDTVVKKARQRLYHLRQLRRFRVSQRILKSFYAATTQSILTGAITVWYGNSSSRDQRALQRVVRSAERIMGTSLPPLQDLYTRRCLGRARRIFKDPHHPGNKLFVTLRSGKRLRCHKSNTERLRKSFFPQAIKALNSALSSNRHTC